MKKKISYAVLTALFLVFASCASSKKALPECDELSTRTLIATVIAQKNVLIGEYKEGSREVSGELTEKIITWEGFKLLLRSEDGMMYEYLSHELFFEGDRVLMKVQNGKVLSVKFSP